MTEREIQRKGVQALRKLGFEVVVTSNRMRTANTKGTPDVFVFKYKGGRGWLALEVKAPSGKVSKEQSRLEEHGAVTVCRSVDEMVEACL